MLFFKNKKKEKDFDIKYLDLKDSKEEMKETVDKFIKQYKKVVYLMYSYPEGEDEYIEALENLDELLSDDRKVIAVFKNKELKFVKSLNDKFPLLFCAELINTHNYDLLVSDINQFIKTNNQDK